MEATEKVTSKEYERLRGDLEVAADKFGFDSADTSTTVAEREASYEACNAARLALDAGFETLLDALEAMVLWFGTISASKAGHVAYEALVLLRKHGRIS